MVISYDENLNMITCRADKWGSKGARKFYLYCYLCWIIIALFFGMMSRSFTLLIGYLILGFFFIGILWVAFHIPSPVNTLVYLKENGIEILYMETSKIKHIPASNLQTIKIKIKHEYTPEYYSRKSGGSAASLDCEYAIHFIFKNKKEREIYLSHCMDLKGLKDGSLDYAYNHNLNETKKVSQLIKDYCIKNYKITPIEAISKVRLS